MINPFQSTNQFSSAEKTFLQTFADLPVSQGDVFYVGSDLQVHNLGAGTSGYFLKTQGAGANPVWASSTGSAPAIGGTLTSGTAGSVLFSGSAVFAQDNSQFFWDDTNHWLGIGTAVPTNSVTVASSGNGVALYNTTDQVTNYEKVTASWVSNAFVIQMTKGGTGSNRVLQIGDSADGNITLQPGSSPAMTFTRPATNSAGTIFSFTTGNLTSSNVVQTGIGITPTLLQTDTAGYTALLVNPTETSTGSGAKLLADFQVGGTSKVSITNAGVIATSISGTQLQFQANSFIVSSTNGSLALYSTFASKVFSLGSANNAATTFQVALDTGHITVEGVTSTGATGTGAFVFASSPTLVTPALGVATATSINGLTVTTSTGILTIANTVTLTINHGFTIGGTSTGGLNYTAAKTLTISNSLTLAGTDSTTMTFPATSDTVGGLATAQTWTGTQTFNRMNPAVGLFTVTSNAVSVGTGGFFNINNITNNAAGSVAITLVTTGAVDGQMLVTRFYDFSAAAQTLTWVNTENSLVSVPATSNGSTTLPLTVGFMYNGATSKWRCIASA